jgi:hypothetical protein
VLDVFPFIDMDKWSAVSQFILFFEERVCAGSLVRVAWAKFPNRNKLKVANVAISE